MKVYSWWVTAHESPGEYVERCVRLARLITREQFGQLVGLYGTEIDKAVHEALKRYLSGLGTPNPLTQ